MQATFEFQVSPVADALRSPVARRTDPVSSHEAAKEVTESGRRESQLLLVLALLRKRGPATSLELSTLGIDRYVVARRLPELEVAGRVRRCGITQCSVGKRSATLWEAL